MDSVLCDELLQEIFLLLSSKYKHINIDTNTFRQQTTTSTSVVSLVSKRWLRLYRSSLTHLSLSVSPSIPLSPFLSHFPFLSSLHLSLPHSLSADSLLLSIPLRPNLRHFCLVSGPVSPFSLISLSTSCPYLVTLSVSLSRPVSLVFLTLFRSLKDLSIKLDSTQFLNPDFNTTQFGSSVKDSSFISPKLNSSSKSPNFSSSLGNPNFISTQYNSSVKELSFISPEPNSNTKSPYFEAELQLETLTLSCVRNDDYALDWLYRSCKKLKKIRFRGCEGIGDNPLSSSFINCIRNVEEVELRTCRMIIDNVLVKLADNSKLLNSLLVYDGGCREGFLRFIQRSDCNLRKFDLRLPLDLDNRHLITISEKFRGLTSLKLQSSCLVTGEGLKAICSSTRDGLEELALINCDVAEREPGLLMTLGQNLKGLKKLDLSYNEMLTDKELVSMIVSCGELRELKLRGCRALSNLVLLSVSKCCKKLECVDIMYCCGIEGKGLEMFMLNMPRLKELKVEDGKLSDEVMNLVY